VRNWKRKIKDAMTTLTGLDASTGAAVAVSFGRVIQAVDPLISGPADAPYLAPGLIDLQVNGFAGVDYNSPQTPLEEIARSIRVLFSTGVTRFLPTVITGDPAAMTAALRNLARARTELPEGRAIEGFHVEGPHISPEDGPRGAHPREWVRPPDLDEFKRWQEAAEGGVRLVTLSPEWPEAPRYIEALVDQGVVVSIGHTKATTEQIQDAVRAGATKSTHLGNGAHAMIQRHPNYIWDQLAEDRLAAGFIVDGIHLPASFLKVAIRAKGIERSILVTDAVMPAGCRPGRFRIGGVEIELHPDNRVTLAGQDRLAGSALRMDRGLENLMRLAGLTLPQALTMATRNPARVGRIAGRQRGLTPGDRADLVEFRYDPETSSIEVLRTFLDGELVWRRDGGAS
jgi:N-acetylglucosamine-6-phosphate deacetylase